LLAIEGIGIIQNVFIAGKMRCPAVYGMPLTFIEVIGSLKVMETVFEVKDKYPYAGANMVNIFFSGGKLRDDEKKKWKDLQINVRERWQAWKLQESGLIQ